MNSHDMYWWIFEHPELNKHRGGDVTIEITPHLVCPETRRIEKYEFLNTKMEFWVELMMFCMDEYEGKEFPSSIHDWELDCGGDTWDEAVENLYNKVLEKYGDYDNSPKEMTAEEIEDLEKFMASIKTTTIRTKELDEFEIEMINGYISDARQTIKVLEKRKLAKYADKVMLQKCIDELNAEIQDYKKQIE